MRSEKIDKCLILKVGTLTENHIIECIIKAFDYKRLKNYLNKQSIKILHEYLFINSFRVQINKSQLEGISNLTQVEFIYSISNACALMHISKNILQVDATFLTGRGINIAFIDTGINPHFDFMLGQKRIKFFKDFLFDKKNIYDDNGHGTFVSGVCSGNGAMSGGKFAGIAPQSEIFSLKALNNQGEASADKILDAMEWVYDNHRKYNIQIVCMSFGSEPLGYNDPIMSGSEALWRSGITVVAAAGNSGPEFQTIKSPGVSSHIITVGGFDDNRFDNGFNEAFFEIAKFSSRGPAFQRYKPDLVAPSVDITSCGISRPYTVLSGTSVATPMVAGLAALMLEKEPYLRPDEIKKRLLTSCKAITFNRNLEGFGYPIFQE